MAAWVAFAPLAGHAETRSAPQLIGQALSTKELVIFDEGLGAHYVLRLGDELRGGKLVFIGNDHVVISRSGVEETLPMAVIPRPGHGVTKPLVLKVDPILVPASPTATFPSNGTVAIRPPPAFAAAKNETTVTLTPVLLSAPGVPAPSAPPPTPAAVFQVRLSRAAIDRGLGDLCAVDASVVIELAPQGGFHVAELQAGSFLEHMGLRSGDIIVSVDGRPLRNAQDALRTYNWVRVADHFVVELLRDGSPITMRFQIDR